MSYILDALKRAEQERQIGQIPNAAAAPPAEAYDSERQIWPWLLLAVLLLAAAVVALLFWFSSASSSSHLSSNSTSRSAGASSGGEVAVAKAEAPLVITTATPNNGPALTLPTRVTAVKAEPTLVKRAEPLPAKADKAESSPTAVRPAMRPSNPATRTEAVAVPATPVNRSPVAAETAVKLTNQPAAPVLPQTQPSTPDASEFADDKPAEEQADHELPWLKEMPLAFRRNVPTLEIQFHRYSDDRSRSFVMIAGQRYGEGQALKSGPTLERIVEEGLILRWRGERFIYPLGG